MTFAHRRTTRARSKMDRAPLSKDVPLVLLPVLAELRAANGPLDVSRLFEESIPDHLHAPAVAFMSKRPQLFKPETIADAIRLIGFAALARKIGLNPAHVAAVKYCGARIAA